MVGPEHIPFGRSFYRSKRLIEGSIVFWEGNETGVELFLEARWAGYFDFADMRSGVGVIVDISYAVVGESCDIGESGGKVGERAATWSKMSLVRGINGEDFPGEEPF